MDVVTSTCYRVTSKPLVTWLTARDGCKDKGEMLVVLEPVEKAQFIVGFLNLAWPGSMRNFHIGASRPADRWNTTFPATGPDYVWETGQPVNMSITQSFWEPGKPDNKDNDNNVVRLSGKQNYALDDTEGIWTSRYICERPSQRTKDSFSAR
ncbi:uncharacterized protein [Littorina saxatilis]|uniref:uncharacterized protein n=1 Tax=Littorina saxatilis TaxID=31220 RepID=UPI0038B47DCB